MSDRFPFPDNPTGWFRVALGGEIRRNELRTMHFFGRELIAFRADDGRAQVMEAHCPHLGAHIGVGGRIEGDCVVCPFHGWTFDPAGRNARIPYRQEVNRKARLRTFEARDWCGFVMVWFDEGGSGPTWELPDLPALHDRTLLWHVPDEAHWRVRTHPQEILENTVDIAHFQFVHGVPSFGQLTSAEEGPMLRTTAELTLTTPRGTVTGAVVNEMWGLGIDINRVVGVGDACAVLGITPVDGEYLDASFAFLSPRASDGEGIGRFGRGHVRDTIVQFEADIPIWENKVHRSNPSLAIGEGPILGFRRWAAQFYAGAFHREPPPPGGSFGGVGAWSDGSHRAAD
jgi:phenylpropionate dioxygenase-like ring-hydroxylating dioxygenase large terminal subunit